MLGCRIVLVLLFVMRVFWSRFVNGVYSLVVIDNVWYFGFIVSNFNLIIINVVFSDVIIYQCLVINNVGMGNSGMMLFIVIGSKQLKYL